MKLAIWIVAGVFALLWTGGAFAVSELAHWALRHAGDADVVELGRQAAQWPVPRWLAIWVDPQWIRALQSATLWLLERFDEVLPTLGAASAWLVAAVWVLWGLGMATLLLLAGGAHLFVGWASRPPARAA